MLSGMISAMLGRMTGLDAEAVREARGDPELMQVVSNPRMLAAVQEVTQFEGNVSKFRDDPEVMRVVEKVAALSGRRLALESSEAAPAEGLPNGRDLQRRAARGVASPEATALAIAERRQAELRSLRDARLRREASVKVMPLVYDLDQWQEMSWFVRTTELGRLLAQKGFCLLKGGVGRDLRERALQEAAALKKNGSFTRPPKEVLCGLFGDVGSAWTRDLGDPSGLPADGEEALRDIDTHISDLGTELASCTEMFFGMRIQGRTNGVAHLSRTPEDRANPPLVDPLEADSYMARFMRKKLKMVYYAGPGLALLTVNPIGEETEAFRTQLQPGTILVLRGDVCRCTVDPRSLEPGLTIEVDFMAETKSGPQEVMRDRVPAPEALNDWYVGRLRAIVDNDVMENVPDDWMKLARQTFFKTTPTRVLQVSHSLPTTVLASEKWACPFQGCALGGNDCITEIPLSKWDIDAYYDPDPMNVDDFKMYTRHMGVLDRSHLSGEAYSLGDFGISSAEAGAIDHRHVMLCESATLCLRMADMSKADTQGKDVGVFCGISGSEMYYQFISREAKLGKATHSNMSNAANVNRLSYLFGSTGPSMAIDTENSSGSAAVDTAVAYLREGRCSFGLAGGVSLVQHPFTLIIACAAGSLSKSGRPRVFDEMSDGTVTSEGVVTLLLQAHKSPASPGEEDGPPAPEVRALILGSALNSKGVSSSLTSPSAQAILDVVQRALKDAHCPGSIIDSVETSAGGHTLADAMELGMMKKALVSSEERPSTSTLQSFKSSIGEAGAAGGPVSLARALLCLEKAVHGPTIHLHQLFEIGATCGEDDETETSAGRLHIPCEVVEARSSVQTVGVTSFGSSGTNVHHVVWGHKPEELQQPYLGKPIHWFPTTGGLPEEEEDVPEASYHIVGTWNAWERPCQMEAEADGVYSYTVTLGENRWESFQIWVDGDKDQVLHPQGHWAEKNTEVVGPSKNSVCGRFATWCINGRTTKVRLINEEQAEALEDSDKVPGPDEPKTVVAYKGNFRPPGHESAQDASGMPVMEVNAELAGVPGDLYTVRLHTRGKYRRVEWSKARRAARLTAVAEVYEHKYYVVGDFNYWTFAPMEAVEGKPGHYTAEVQLLRDGGALQIVRDRDWDQTFYPQASGSSAEEPICGPDGMGLGKTWKLGGQVGDIFRVTFRRSVSSDGTDTRTLDWELLHNKRPNFEELAKEHKYYMVGSWTDFTKLAEMEFDEGRGAFSKEVTIGSRGKESFQILLNANWLAVVHPSANEASFRDTEHRVEGPDDAGSNRFWTIGRHKDDGVAPGDRVRVLLFVEGGLPRRVSWERLEPEARQFADSGC